MHTFRKLDNGAYDVIFANGENERVIFADCHFDMAIWYVNILNGGSGKFDKDKA